jgi:hypothetical protein
MAICIAMNPLSKIFIHEWQDILMKDPIRVFTEEDFAIRVPRSAGDVHFRFNTPKQVTERNMLNWIAGGESGEESQETDWTGIVALPLTEDDTGLLFATMTKPAKDLMSKINDAKELAKERSQARVMRQIRFVHGNLKKQYQTNQEQGANAYSPSITEFLCAYVLSAEENKRSEDLKKITDTFKALMTNTMVG